MTHSTCVCVAGRTVRFLVNICANLSALEMSIAHTIKRYTNVSFILLTVVLLLVHSHCPCNSET